MSPDIAALHPKKILIRSTNWVGDAIMTTPAVRSIRMNFPRAHISLLALPWVADVFVASPYIDRIIPYDKTGQHQGIRGRIKLINILRQQQFDLAILLQNAFEAALVAKLASIPARAGYTTDGRFLLLTHRARVTKRIKTRHQVYYYQEMLTRLGLQTGPDELYLHMLGKTQDWAEDFIRNLQKRSGKIQYLVGLNPGASYGPAKRWPAEKYGELAARIIENYNAVMLVFGTEADRKAAAIIQRYAPAGCVDLTGKTTLVEAMALIARCNAFMTNDSGLMHVAAALQTPLVAIFGSTNPVTTGPFSLSSRVVRQEIPCSPCMQTHCKTDFRCMQEIPSDEVFDALTEMLNRYEGSNPTTKNCGIS
jgi:heptosyltransferase-2